MLQIQKLKHRVSFLFVPCPFIGRCKHGAVASRKRERPSLEPEALLDYELKAF